MSNGFGREIVGDDGSYYIGMFKDDKYHGKGKFVFANGDIYEGLFKDGE